MYIFFKVCAKTIGLRSSEADEIAGLDIPEMGVHGYYDGDVVKGSIEVKPSGAGVLGYADPDKSKA
jgi:Amt family ammonium transporter